MPAGDKYLALLAGMPHRAFAGGILEAGEALEARPAEPGNDWRGAGSSGGHGGSGAHEHFNAANAHSHGGSAEANAGSTDADHAMPDREVRQRLSLTELAMGVATVQEITPAFLDATVKQDGIAREWLDKEASRRLTGKGN